MRQPRSRPAFPGYEATIWLGLMAPAGTPKPIIDKLNAAVNAAVKRPDIVKHWTHAGRGSDVDDARKSSTNSCAAIL